MRNGGEDEESHETNHGSVDRLEKSTCVSDQRNHSGAKLFLFPCNKTPRYEDVSRCPCTTKQCLSKANTLGSKLIQKRITKCCYLATPSDHTIQSRVTI